MSPSRPESLASAGDTPVSGTTNTGTERSSPARPSPDVRQLFQCSLCEKSFNRTENLSRHMKTHAATKFHVCSVCGKGFTRSDLLKRHEGVHKRHETAGTPHVTADMRKRRRVEDETSESPGSAHSYNTVPSGYRGHSHHVQLPTRPIAEARPPMTNVLDPALARLQNCNQLIPQYNYPQYNMYSQMQNSQDWRHVPQMRPDYSALLSIDYDNVSMMDSWFTGEFYTALHETDFDWMNIDQAITPHHIPLLTSAGATQPPKVVDDPKVPDVVVELEEAGKRIRRVSSPPNDTSAENKIPFAWDPKTTRMFTAKPIEIKPELYRSHNPIFDITEETYRRLASHFRHDRAPSRRKHYTLPSHSDSNILIGLFFQYFYPQVPVLHLATLNLNDNSIVPPELIAIMIVIGSIYSFQLHSRRFAIVFLDDVRRTMLDSLENDNSNMRDSHFLYAMLLVVHTGIWCGNKKAFEVAESLRGSMITHCRRLAFGKDRPSKISETTSSREADTRWRQWAKAESQKRLCWCIYTMDAQFPMLINLAPHISISEMSDIDLPCEEAFWLATTAEYWVMLVGPRDRPESTSFAAAIAPFMMPFLGGSLRNHQAQSQIRDIITIDGPPLLALHSWGRMLVLLAISIQVFDFNHDLMLANNSCGEHSQPVTDRDLPGGAAFHASAASMAPTWERFDPRREGPETFQTSTAEEMRARSRGQPHTRDWPVWSGLAWRKDQLATSLSLWSTSYGQSPPADMTRSASSKYFFENAKLIQQLDKMNLELPLREGQDAIGLVGSAGISRAMDNLTIRIKASPQKILRCTLVAVRIISALFPKKRGDDSTETLDSPYGTLTFFLCHVNLWAFVSVAHVSLLVELLRIIEDDESLRASLFFPIVQRILRNASQDSGTAAPPVAGSGVGAGSTLPAGRSKTRDAARLVFRSAANVLMRQGTWGCSLDMALLAHSRAEM